MLPKLLAGRRRWLMGLLVLSGVGMAALAGISAVLMTWLLEPQNRLPVLVTVGGLLLAALGTGGLRAVERILAERLGQDYIHQIRVGLVEAGLVGDRGPSPGITIARTTNDLSSVRNWVAMGISPLAVGIPLILGTSVALWLLAPPLAVAVVVPLALMAGALALLAGPAYRRARMLRRKRGKLAAHIADTVAASSTIRSAGGTEREVKQVNKIGLTVAGAAVDRAITAGWIRGAAAAAAALAAAAVAVVGTTQGVATATVAGALTIVGIISAPVSDMGKVIEYRQNFKAARRILGPALAAGIPAARQRQDTGQADIPSHTGVHVSGLSLEPKGHELAPLNALPRDRIVVRAADPAQATDVVERILGIREDPDVYSTVAGVNLATAAGTERRTLIGYAASSTVLERGTIARAVRYRRPELPSEEGSAALDRAGLSGQIVKLPDGERTRLKRGGEPLTVSQRARLLIARAALGEPPLLVLNRIDAELDHTGRKMLAELVRTYPGVVMLVPATAELEQVEADVELHADTVGGTMASGWDAGERETA
ncbi:ABC transporter transmembrane domain-containing protein [Arthrobacter pigmenti]